MVPQPETEPEPLHDPETNPEPEFHADDDASTPISMPSLEDVRELEKVGRALRV